MVNMTSHSVVEEYARILVVLHAVGAMVCSVFLTSTIWPVSVFFAAALRGLGPVGSGSGRRFFTIGVVTSLVATSIALRPVGVTGLLSSVLSFFLGVKLVAEDLGKDRDANPRG